MSQQNMVLFGTFTYLHVLDPEDLPLTKKWWFHQGKCWFHDHKVARFAHNLADVWGYEWYNYGVQETL